MSVFDMFSSKKDPDVVAAEKRAYDEEAARVKLEKKNAAMRAASARGKAKARGGSGVEAGAAKVGKGILKAGGSLMKLGEYGAGLNWGGGVPEPARATKGKPKKGKKQKQQPQRDPFEMPEFPF